MAISELSKKRFDKSKTLVIIRFHYTKCRFPNLQLTPGNFFARFLNLKLTTQKLFAPFPKATTDPTKPFLSFSQTYKESFTLFQTYK